MANQTSQLIGCWTSSPGRPPIGSNTFQRFQNNSYGRQQQRRRHLTSSPYETCDETDFSDLRRKDEDSSLQQKQQHQHSHQRTIYRQRRNPSLLPSYMRQEGVNSNQSSAAKLRNCNSYVPVMFVPELNGVEEFKCTGRMLFEPNKSSFSIPTELSRLSCPEVRHSGTTISSGTRSYTSSYTQRESTGKHL